MSHRLRYIEFSRSSLSDQAASFLREQIRKGRWQKNLPGLSRLSKEIGVSRNTLMSSVNILESEGMVLKCGEGKPVKITGNMGKPKVEVKQVNVMLMEPLESLPKDEAQRVLRLWAEVKAWGYTSEIWSISDQRTTRTAFRRMLEEAAADAWAVNSCSREVQEWLLEHQVPAFAVGGVVMDMQMPLVGSSDIRSLIRTSTRNLLNLGHRRIVFLTRKELRLPVPSMSVMNFQEELRLGGVMPSRFHLPDWEESPEGLSGLLEGLCRLTPPTAIICQTHKICMGVMGYLQSRGFKVPNEVSVVSLAPMDDVARWIFPGVEIASVETDDEMAFRAFRHWLECLSEGSPREVNLIHDGKLKSGNSVSRPCAV